MSVWPAMTHHGRSCRSPVTASLIAVHEPFIFYQSTSFSGLWPAHPPRLPTGVNQICSGESFCTLYVMLSPRLQVGWSTKP